MASYEPLNIQGLEVELGGKKVVNNVSLSVDSGDWLSIIGPNGSGKSSLLRAITEKERSAIIVASYGTFSTGINIRNLHNIVFSSPSKSRIRVLQSIGRGLRTSSTKTSTVVFDIADDLSHGHWTNFTYNHFQERINIYNEEEFNYQIDKVKL